MSNRTESVREITWFLGYSGFRTKIFGYAVSTGVKEGSNFPFVSVDEHSVTDSELTITLTDFRDENMTLGCEVEVIRDNGYGKLRHDKKLGNSIVKAVDNGQHQLILKADPGLQNQAIPDKEVVVSCVSQGANPPPKLSLMVDGRNLTEIYTGTVQEGVVPDQKEVNLMGRIERLPEHLFKNSYLTIECLAHFDDFLFAKKEISLQKRDAMSSPSSIPNYDEEQKSRYMRPGANRRNDVDDSNGYLRPGMIPQDSGSFGRTGRVDEGYQADVIHSKLLDLMDPARHIHPGIPYDFFAGYLLMVSDEVNPTVEGNGHTTILGELPYEVETALHRHYGRVNQVTHEKTQIKMDPIKFSTSNMFAMGITRQRERDTNASQSRKSEREAYERKVQREIARELAKQEAETPQEEDDLAKTNTGSFYDVCKNENETLPEKPKGRSQAAAYRELKKKNSNPELKK
ncbi:hypothetical protein TCAL_16484 [Tigriopus californicus]|uniref:CD80-like immunoglobulin C2-set domain-containing protein n=1 Tax=Tigriopus californicus TaxID=6832 RepID=A0A553NUD0_TIGCA|nr:hypothetical protein TCAL_16484 [Tigriopus californicus]